MKFQIKLHWQILMGIILGIVFGIVFPNIVPYFEWIGIIFINALKMIVVPLILTSIVSGISSIGNSSYLGRLSFKTILYYLFTSLLALFTGLFFVNLFHPGAPGILNIPVGNGIETEKSLIDTLVGIIPTNIFEAFQNNNHMLSIIFLAMLFGIFITKLKDKSRILLQNIFDSLFELMMKITMFIMRFAPLGIFALIAQSVSNQDNIGLLMQSLGKFTVTCLLALTFHFFITLPVLLLIFARINPLKHFRAMIIPLLTAFSTASSNATLPLTIQEIENKSKVSNKISSFTLPLGATINMDGTALYELVVAIFIAQALGIELSFIKQFIIITTALLASIGTAGIPMASYTTMAIIFTAIGLPIETIAIVLPVDRILDMCRTATNVWSDTCCTVIIAKSEKEDIYTD